MSDSHDLAEHFRKAGWMPSSPTHLKRFLHGALRSVAGQNEVEFLPVIKDFQKFIEDNGEMRMGFNRMFEDVTETVSNPCSNGGTQ
jgi:phosphatidylserine decarboxylase